MDRRLTGEQLDELWGHTVWSRDGERMGTLEDVFPEHGGFRPRWIGVATGLFGTRLVLVPLDGAYVAADGVVTAHTRADATEAPELHHDHLDARTAEALDAYWSAVRQADRAAS